MLIKNCNIVYKDCVQPGSLLIENGKIVDINPINTDTNEILDAKGLFISPGFIDVHIHGAGGRDTMDGTLDSLNHISKVIANAGTTSFLPTTMTASLEECRQAVAAVAEAKSKGTEGAEVLGAHLEGPFINPNMLGAQNPKYVQAPSITTFQYIAGDHTDVIKSVTLAPEADGAHVLIDYLQALGITVSMGHTKATYDEAVKGIHQGVQHSTHLYNAMTGLHHRDAGAVGAIFDTDITTETIADGIHIAYPALRIAYRQKGLDKVLLVTDAMMACGMVEGTYSLGGLEVIVKDGAARLKQGNLAGSILTLDKAVKNVLANTDYEMHEVIRMATYNPAKLCKVDHKKGIIQKGYDADLILFDKNISIKGVMIGGKVFKNNL